MDNNNSLASLSRAVEAIKTAILQGQYEALKNVNRVQLAVYYAIGKYLSENTRKGVWGTDALQQISDQLLREMPGLRGFSVTNLKKMRLFYEQWQMLDVNSCVTTHELDQNKSCVAMHDLQTSEYQIDVYHSLGVPNVTDFPIEDFFNVPFTHHVEIFKKVESLPARYYYIHRTAEEHLSVDKLTTLIQHQAYENHDAITNNFVNTIPNSSMARKAVMMFKDSYALEFINSEQIGERDRSLVDERVVEQQIIQNIKEFILTFGQDFAFIGNQYHLEIYGEEFFPDLLFFNRELNAMVVVELKIDDFKPIYLSQLMTYMRILDDKVKKPHENPSIGIVLCKGANKDMVEYVIQDYPKPMGVATYKTAEDMPARLRKALPDENKLKELLSGDKENA